MKMTVILPCAASMAKVKFELNQWRMASVHLRGTSMVQGTIDNGLQTKKAAYNGFMLALT
jgi:hypothetical protein